MRIINVSYLLFVILSETGFSELMNITKRIEEIDTEGLEIIGKGTFGMVFHLGEDAIVKVYDPTFRLTNIEKERFAARAAFVRRAPTAIPFKTVRAGERYGLVFEQLKLCRQSRRAHRSDHPRAIIRRCPRRRTEPEDASINHDKRA